MRTIKELLTIVLKNKKLFEDAGLCWLIHQLQLEDTINDDEYTLLNDYIHEQLKGHKEYWYVEDQSEPFYFPIGKWPPRERWLKSKIKKLS